MNDTVGAILLGAGVGRRFGSDKRLVEVEINGRMQTIAEHTIDYYSIIFKELRLVIRTNDKNIRALLRTRNVDFVEAADAHQGMGHSLAAGLAGLQWRYAFIGLLDMPFLQPESLRQIKARAAATNFRKIVRPRLDPELISESDAEMPPWGHPIGIPHALFAEACIPEGDQGARKLLRKHPDLVEEVLISDTGIIRDVDRPGDISTSRRG